MYRENRKQCFRHYETATIPVAEVTIGGFTLPPASRRKWLEGVSSDRVLEEIDRLRVANPARGRFEICGMLGICPTGLLRREDWDIVSLESACRDYGSGYLEAAGYWPPSARTLEGMEVIRQTRNEIEGRKWASMKQKQKGGNRG